jgi:hypothetical protein
MADHSSGRCFKERDIVLLSGKEEAKKAGSRIPGGKRYCPCVSTCIAKVRINVIQRKWLALFIRSCQSHGKCRKALFHPF